jgi:hypothetical protein
MRLLKAIRCGLATETAQWIVLGLLIWRLLWILQCNQRLHLPLLVRARTAAELGLELFEVQ